MRIFSICAAAVAIVGAAHATPSEPVEAEFTYSKALLQTEEGAEKVLAQLVRHVQSACQIEITYHRKISRRFDHACFDKLMTDAVEKIDADSLTRAYQEADS